MNQFSSDPAQLPVTPETALKIHAGVAAILRDADADIAARKPVCKASGRCCKFEHYGHRLYVTAAEIIHFQQALVNKNSNSNARDSNGSAASVSLPQFFAQVKPEGCPYQIDGMCTARQARPLGCRIYFCDENAQHWQNDVYEKYHARLTALHDSFGIPYQYMEWRIALTTLVTPAPAP
jgi:Fe-S-cluster containining protein